MITAKIKLVVLPGPISAASKIEGLSKTAASAGIFPLLRERLIPMLAGLLAATEEIILVMGME